MKIELLLFWTLWSLGVSHMKVTAGLSVLSSAFTMVMEEQYVLTSWETISTSSSSRMNASHRIPSRHSVMGSEKLKGCSLNLQRVKRKKTVKLIGQEAVQLWSSWLMTCAIVPIPEIVGPSCLQTEARNYSCSVLTISQRMSWKWKEL